MIKKNKPFIFLTIPLMASFFSVYSSQPLERSNQVRRSKTISFPLHMHIKTMSDDFNKFSVTQNSLSETKVRITRLIDTCEIFVQEIKGLFDTLVDLKVQLNQGNNMVLNSIYQNIDITYQAVRELSYFISQLSSSAKLIGEIGLKDSADKTQQLCEGFYKQLDDYKNSLTDYSNNESAPSLPNQVLEIPFQTVITNQSNDVLDNAQHQTELHPSSEGDSVDSLTQTKEKIDILDKTMQGKIAISQTDQNVPIPMKYICNPVTMVSIDTSSSSTTFVSNNNQIIQNQPAINNTRFCSKKVCLSTTALILLAGIISFIIYQSCS